MHILLNIFFPQKKESHGLDLEDLTDTRVTLVYCTDWSKSHDCLDYITKHLRVYDWIIVAVINTESNTKLT